MKAEIKKVQQTLPNNCVSACLAMLTGLPIEKVTEDFHQRYLDDTNVHESSYLHEWGYKHKELLAFFRAPQPGHIYVATVPSLNIVGGTHAIVIHYTSDHEFLVYDPNEGREDKKFYVNGPLYSGLAVQLTSYQCTVEITEAEFLTQTTVNKAFEEWEKSE